MQPLSNMNPVHQLFFPINSADASSPALEKLSSIIQQYTNTAPADLKKTTLRLSASASRYVWR